MKLEQEGPGGGEGEEAGEAPQRSAQLSFVDLAGSERAGRTGNSGTRLKWVKCPALQLHAT